MSAKSFPNTMRIFRHTFYRCDLDGKLVPVVAHLGVAESIEEFRKKVLENRDINQAVIVSEDITDRANTPGLINAFNA